MAAYKIVEKKNHNAVHAHCATKESAERWLNVLCPEYVAKKYFIDKTLNADSFEIIENVFVSKKKR